MPLGPYSDFSTCVTAQQNKGKSAEAARKICGEMQQQIEGSVVEQFTDPTNTKYYVKAFLLDDELNKNEWRVTKESIERNINGFIGKPLVLTENFDHPMSPEPETYAHWLSYQESFRVGTIIDIATKPNPLTGSTIYYAIIEVTDDSLKQALRDNTVPLYVSPAMAEMIPIDLTAHFETENPGKLVEFWAPVHLAIVDEPAYGIKKAAIVEQCGGNEKGCLLQLRKAHIEKFGIGKCGFCVKKALDRYKTMYQMAVKRQNNNAVNLTRGIDTSHTFRTASLETGKRKDMAQLESITDSSNSATNSNNSTANLSNSNHNVIPGRDNINDTAQDTVRAVENLGRPTSNKQAVPQNSAVAGALPNAASTGSNVADLYAEIQTLRHENQLKDIKIEELTSITDTYNQRIANLETEKRIEKIQAIITPDIIRDEKQRLEKIKFFVGTTIPIEQIEELYKDIKITLKKASVNNSSRRQGVPYPGATTIGSSGIATSSNNGGTNHPIEVVDEETGLTQLQIELAVLRGGP